MAKRRPHRVACLVADGVAPFELGVACEVFGIDRSELVDPWYRLEVCAERPGRIETSAGHFALDVAHGLEAIARADTVIVPAWTPAVRQPGEPTVAALRAAHARGARMLSVCSGVFVLAYAGLLDGRRATTHWMHVDELTELFPEVEVDPGVLYVDEGSVLTSAGTAAGIDLCLHVVRLDHGAEVANAVARRMVVPAHRDGGQAQFVHAPVPRCADDDPLATALDWAVRNLDRELTIDDLAAEATMSRRTFARRFRAATGTTPLRWLLHQRVLRAQQLLESTDDPIELVATRCGFGSAAVLRQHFARQVKTSPQAYRRAFRSEPA